MLVSIVTDNTLVQVFATVLIGVLIFLTIERRLLVSDAKDKLEQSSAIDNWKEIKQVSEDTKGRIAGLDNDVKRILKEIEQSPENQPKNLELQTQLNEKLEQYGDEIKTQKERIKEMLSKNSRSKRT